MINIIAQGVNQYQIKFCCALFKLFFVSGFLPTIKILMNGFHIRIAAQPINQIKELPPKNCS